MNQVASTSLETLVGFAKVALFTFGYKFLTAAVSFLPSAGNYELVCFWGSKTMAEIRQQFLRIRPHIFDWQRPFKFHYYPVSDWVHPDRHWSEADKTRCRKCKHILVSVDEMQEQLSQTAYEEQVTSFIGHLVVRAEVMVRFSLTTTRNPQLTNHTSPAETVE
jgi:hypothetical protein